ncbi:MAG: hypothetical protein KDD50_03115 [Bdellovibrionales bacterium]|nr:hypothetical protein [Bdellovibrionales bacterium]
MIRFSQNNILNPIKIFKKLRFFDNFKRKVHISFMVFSVLLFGGVAFAELSLEGSWESSSGSILIFHKHENQWMAYSQIQYVNEYGEEIGESIEYFYKLSLNQGNFNNYCGTLETYDNYYDCSLNNGEITIQFLSKNRIQMMVPVIKFKKVTIGPSRRIKSRVPYYCDSRWGSYICGWEWREQTVREGGTSHCEITYRNYQIVTLKKREGEGDD